MNLKQLFCKHKWDRWHDFTRWYDSPFNPNLKYRKCLRCKKWEEKIIK